MKPKIGYLLPTRENIMRDDHSGASLMTAAKNAHDLGFDSLWAGDSLLARPRHDPLTLLAAVAGALPGTTVGTAVLLPALRNPVVLAQQLATIDQLSNGNLIIGAGIAADNPAIRAEFTAAGVTFEKRLGRFMEGMRLCRALWSGEPVDWDGRWQLSNATLAPKPYRPEGPPIWIGTTVDAGIERIAKHYDGWFPIGPNAQSFAEREALLQTKLTEAGRTNDAVTRAIYLTVAIGADEVTQEAAIDAYLEDYYNVPAKLMRHVQACCGGPLDRVLGFIRQFAEAGAQHIVLRLVGEHTSQLQLISDHRAEI